MKSPTNSGMTPQKLTATGSFDLFALVLHIIPCYNIYFQALRKLSVLAFTSTSPEPILMLEGYVWHGIPLFLRFRKKRS